MDSSPRHSEAFVQCLIAHQAQIRAFVRTLVPDAATADDLLQEVNLVLWRKADQFEPGTRFGAWACRVAYLQVLAHRQKTARQKLVFDDALLGRLSAAAETRLNASDARKEALRRCLQKLSDEQRELLRHRYTEGTSPQLLSEKLNRPVGSVRQTLYRIRATLSECLKQTLPGLETR